MATNNNNNKTQKYKQNQNTKQKTENHKTVGKGVVKLEPLCTFDENFSNGPVTIMIP